jgi:ABC-type multidrug transport system fused ATPase/permease subunit
MIHTLAREEYMQKLYDALIDESYASVDKVNFYNSVYSPVIVVSSCAVISMMMLFAAMGGEVQKFFGLTVGSAIAIISYVGKIFTPLEDIGMEIENIQAAMAGIERVNIFLNENERMMPSISVKSFTQDRIKADENKLPALELRNVNFSYVKGEPVIQGLSLSVMPSENVTLAGRTGIGKSTVFKLIMGLYVPDSGEVLVFGTNASDIADRGKRRLFGYVEQNLSIIQGSFGEQVSLMDAGINSYDIMKALDIVGLKETVGKLPDGIDTPFEKCALSQGQLQLLSIARAITYNPKILLLDEITANLDSGTEKMVMDALKRASTNRTVISISHRLYESEHNGRLIEIV